MPFDLERFVREEQFIQCPPMTADNFTRLCKACDLRIDRADLEMLEREGLFYPLLRVRFPKYVQKIRTLNNNEYEILGPLEEGESWDGETQEAYGDFYFIKAAAEEFLHEGLLWRPQDRPFQPWKDFCSEDGEKLVESYYSPFQIYHLWHLWESTSLSLSLVSWGFLDEEKLHKSGLEIASLGRELKKVWSGPGSRFTEAVEICVATANRYFPKTQTDRRTIMVSVPAQYHDWDWYEYCRQWGPKAELAKLNIEPNRLRELQKSLASEAAYIDPLDDWYSLVQFVSLERKKKLKGKALLARQLYSMETMLRLFFQDVTGECVPPPHENERYYGQGVPEREMEFLEYLTNQFNLNPRPKLILVLEGEGEFEQLPRLVQAMGYSFDRLGIRLELLRGIGEFTGKKKEHTSGGRLARFIDYNHQLQTIVYVILDNEGGSGKVREQLLQNKSKYPMSRRYITKEDYVFLWDRNFEFDNFSDLEIADALSQIAGTVKLFSEENVRLYRENFGKAGFQLEKLFQSKAKKELSKRDLARVLFEGLLQKSPSDVRISPPKIIKKLEEIIRLAATNYQPTRRESWRQNQESGFLARVASTD